MLITGAAPPGGGRSEVTPRFVRHFNVFCVPQASTSAMQLIFSSTLKVLHFVCFHTNVNFGTTRFLRSLQLRLGTGRVPGERFRFVLARSACRHSPLAENMPLKTTLRQTQAIQSCAKAQLNLWCHNDCFVVHHMGLLYNTPVAPFLSIHKPKPSPFTSAVHPQGFLGGKFDSEIKDRADGIVNATIEVYERISKELLPTPAR